MNAKRKAKSSKRLANVINGELLRVVDVRIQLDKIRKTLLSTQIQLDALADELSTHVETVSEILNNDSQYNDNT